MKTWIIIFIQTKNGLIKGSGCGTIGSTVAYDSYDMGSNPVTDNFYWRIIYCKLFVEKMKINNKRPGIGLFDDVQSEISARVFN